MNKDTESCRLLPIANITRIMKNAFPSDFDVKLSKDAKDTMQECVGEFISFISSEASDKCIRENRKTINGYDIIYALENLGFEYYTEILGAYLDKYKEFKNLHLMSEDKLDDKRDENDDTEEADK